MRTSLKIDSDSKLEIFVDGDTILLKKYRPAGACEFCGEIGGDVKDYKGTFICADCRRKISAL